VDVDVDQAGGDIKPGNVDHLAGSGGGNGGGYFGDLAVLNGDVAAGADAVFGVDEMAALEQQIVGGLGETEGGEEKSPDTHTGCHYNHGNAFDVVGCFRKRSTPNS
jgi:hypothetical protein